MYKDYEVLKIDTTEKMIIIKFRKEGSVDYITRRYYLIDELGETELLRLVEHAQVEAFEFYRRDTISVPFTPQSWSGTLRDIETGPIPEYNPTFETLEEEWVETETTRTRMLNVVPLSIEGLAFQAVAKRRELLELSDSEGLSDRVMSAEMEKYRKDLRDITDQEGFPYNIVWPIAPLG